MNRDNWDSKSADTAINNDVSFELSYSLRYVRFLLRLLGVWPLVVSRTSRFEKNLAKVIRPLAMLLILLIMVPMLAEVIVQRVDPSELLVLVPMITYQLSNFVKLIFLISRANMFKMCTDHMTIDWRKIDNSKDREIMMKNIKNAHKLALIVIISFYGPGALYNAIVPLCTDSTINEFNETIRPLAIPGGDILFDVQARFLYEVVFCAYYISCSYAVAVHVSLLNLTLIFVRHSCGLIQIIESKIETLNDPKVQEVSVLVKKSIAIIVDNHIRLLKFAKYFERGLQEVCFLEVVGATLLIIFMEYCCIKEWGDGNAMAICTYGSLVVSTAFNLLLYCEIGEILKEQCQNIGRAAYMIDWYRLPGKSSLDLVIIMSMSAKPCYLTAGGMMEISRVTFANLMKTSFAYLNVLTTVT